MRIITFYSFKGGVGRTALCANLGAYLARQGARVLLVDWDLRAPGLSYYPDLSEEPNRVGVADFLNAAAEAKAILSAYRPPGHPEGENWREVESALRDHLPPHLLPSRLIAQTPPQLQQALGKVRATSISEALRKSDGLLQLIPAGTRKALTAYREEPWRDKAPRGAIARFVREDLLRLRRQAGEEGEEVIDWPDLDFVLVDAQAGEAPTSLLPRDHLFDSHLFLVGGFNRQNREGLLRALEEMALDAPTPEDDAFDGRTIPLDHFPTFVSVVLSPAPDSSDDVLLDRLETFKDALEGRVLKPRHNVPTEKEAPPAIFFLPYTRALALQEVLLALHEPKPPYAESIEAIATHPVLQREEPVAGYETLVPPPIHPIADLPDWTWLIPGRDPRQAMRAAFQISGEDQADENRLTRLLNVLWWDAGLSDDGFDNLVSGLRDHRSRPSLLEKTEDAIDADRTRQLREPRSSWADQMSDILLATIRFGNWLYRQLRAGDFLTWFLLHSQEQQGFLSQTRWTEFPPFWFFLAKQAAAADRLDLAVDFASEAVRLNPSHLGSRRNLAAYLVALDRGAEALNELIVVEDQVQASQNATLDLAVGTDLAGWLLDLPKGLAYLRQGLSRLSQERWDRLSSVDVGGLVSAALFAGDTDLLRTLWQRSLTRRESQPEWAPPATLLFGVLRCGIDEHGSLALLESLDQLPRGDESMPYRALKELVRLHQGRPPSEEAETGLKRGKLGERWGSWNLWVGLVLGQVGSDDARAFVRVREATSRVGQIGFDLPFLDALEFAWPALATAERLEEIEEIRSLLLHRIAVALSAIKSQTGRAFTPRLEAILEQGSPSTVSAGTSER